MGNLACVPSEPGHFPGRAYFDQPCGVLHLNGGPVMLDEGGANGIGNLYSNIPGNVSFTGNVTMSNPSCSTSNISGLNSNEGNVAAAGSAIGNAAALTFRTNFVTAADDTKGVQLPVPAGVGQEVDVLNSSGANILKVYPDVNGAIANLAANASVNLAAIKGTTFRCIRTSPSLWWSLGN